MHNLHGDAWIGPRDGSVEGVSVVEHHARFVLLVEKADIFARLLKDEFPAKNQCVLFCGNGYPGRAFRVLVRRLHDQLRLPFYVLADNDPAGYELFFLTALGATRRRNAAATSLAIANAAFVGLRVRDYELLELAHGIQIMLSDAERQQLQRFKSYRWLKSDAAWQCEMDVLLQRGFKVEMEALFTLSPSFLADTYLPARLSSDDHLRLPAASRREITD